MEREITNFRKSTASANGEQCISVGSGTGTVAVKDTKDWGGFTLAITPEAWAAFTSSLR
jgi:Domain of unknown function (DUF397)